MEGKNTNLLVEFNKKRMVEELTNLNMYEDGLCEKEMKYILDAVHQSTKSLNEHKKANMNESPSTSSPLPSTSQESSKHEASVSNCSYSNERVNISTNNSEKDAKSDRPTKDKNINLLQKDTLSRKECEDVDKKCRRNKVPGSQRNRYNLNPIKFKSDDDTSITQPAISTKNSSMLKCIVEDKSEDRSLARKTIENYLQFLTRTWLKIHHNEEETQNLYGTPIKMETANGRTDKKSLIEPEYEAVEFDDAPHRTVNERPPKRKASCNINDSSADDNESESEQNKRKKIQWTGTRESFDLNDDVECVYDQGEYENKRVNENQEQYPRRVLPPNPTKRNFKGPRAKTRKSKNIPDISLTEDEIETQLVDDDEKDMFDFSEDPNYKSFEEKNRNEEDKEREMEIMEEIVSNRRKEQEEAEKRKQQKIAEEKKESNLSRTRFRRRAETRSSVQDDVNTEMEVLLQDKIFKEPFSRRLEEENQKMEEKKRIEEMASQRRREQEEAEKQNVEENKETNISRTRFKSQEDVLLQDKSLKGPLSRRLAMEGALLRSKVIEEENKRIAILEEEEKKKETEKKRMEEIVRQRRREQEETERQIQEQIKQAEEKTEAYRRKERLKNQFDANSLLQMNNRDPSPEIDQETEEFLLRDDDDEVEDLVTPVPSAGRKVKIACPICNRMFPQTEIERHASDCNGEEIIQQTRQETLRPRPGPSRSRSNVLECCICDNYQTLDGNEYEEHVFKCKQDKISRPAAMNFPTSPIRSFKTISELTDSEINYKEQFKSKSSKRQKR